MGGGGKAQNFPTEGGVYKGMSSGCTLDCGVSSESTVYYLNFKFPERNLSSAKNRFLRTRIKARFFIVFKLNAFQLAFVLIQSIAYISSLSFSLCLHKIKVCIGSISFDKESQSFREHISVLGLFHYNLPNTTSSTNFKACEHFSLSKGN